jgi:pyrimidine-nucleoside phosphorylase
MRAVDLIIKKRNREELTPKEIEFLVSGFSNGAIPDYQIAAFLMAVYFNGLTFSELGSLTRAMINSGEVFDLSSIALKKVDKHSTGGVGDKVSLVLAPLVASAGVPVPMVSGRGLGHTGGTLDKLESIPGFHVQMNARQFRTQIETIGVAIIGASAQFVPADKKLYALRDVTGTIESIPLIAASIMSKKVASGADAFVMDVKTGNGAFMDTHEEAVRLSRTLVGVGRKMGKEVVVLITDMNQPLGTSVGNALEVREAIATLKASGEKTDLREICLALGAHMLILGQQARSIEDARAQLEKLLHTGKALDKFIQLVTAQQGDPRVVDDDALLNIAPKEGQIPADTDGFIHAYDTMRIGAASMLLGAGRQVYDDPIDHGVGLIVHKKIGDRVQRGEPLIDIFARNKAVAEQVVPMLQDAVTIGPEPLAPPPLIKNIITQDDLGSES